MKAITANYNRKTKAYDVATDDAADLILAHSGWFVYDGSAVSALRFFDRMGTFSDKPGKRAAVRAHLRAAAVALDEATLTDAEKDFMADEVFGDLAAV